MTNFEKIKSMSVEEMAEFLHNIETDVDEGTPILTCCIDENNGIKMFDSYVDIKDWLESEAD